MAIVRIAVGAEVLGTNGGTTAGAGVLNTTGADTLIVLEQFNAATSGTLSDIYGNTWFQLTKRDSNGSECGSGFWYAKNAIVGAGHSVSIAGSSTFSSVAFAAYSGCDLAAPFDTEGGISVTTATTTPIGTITPSNANSLILSGCSLAQASAGCTVDVGTKIAETSSAAVYTGALGELIQSGGPTATGTITWTHVSYKSSGVVAVFKPAGGGGGSTWGPLLGNANNRLVRAA